MTKQNILVIGGGVSGLTTALTLLKSGHKVTVWAKEPAGQLPLTSLNAWATWWPLRSETDVRLERWADESLREFVKLAVNPGSGVAMRRIISLQAQQEEPWYAQKLPFFRHPQVGEIAAQYADAYILDKAPVINPSVYLVWLRQQVIAAGAKAAQMVVSKLDDCPARFDAVINCAGLAARELVDDKSLYPARLQVLRVKANGFDAAVFDDAGPTAIVAHADHIRIGAYYDEGDEALDIDEAAIDAILQRCRLMVPGFVVSREDVLSVTRVLRPERPEIRVEKATLADGRLLVHNYGHDGMGYITSYGIAKEVANYMKA